MSTHLTSYAMFVIPMIVIVAAQSIKFARFSMRHGIDWNYLFTPGHMPSAHSAFVSALVTTIGYYEGVDTGAFAVAVGFATIVMYDAMRIRMQIGEQGKFLNELVRELDKIDRAKFPRLKERVGHYGREVLAGVVFGASVAYILILLLTLWIGA
jgi:acid phosphatase family membrane protein YuiD